MTDHPAYNTSLAEWMFLTPIGPLLSWLGDLWDGLLYRLMCLAVALQILWVMTFG